MTHNTSVIRLMADTNALIRFWGIQMPNKQQELSARGISYLKKTQTEEVILFVSAMSLLEVWGNIVQTEEAKEKLKALFKILTSSSNIRLVEFDDEVLAEYIKLEEYQDFKERDRIIYATAKVYNCSIFVSTDLAIAKYVRHFKEELEIIN